MFDIVKITKILHLGKLIEEIARSQLDDLSHKEFIQAGIPQGSC